MKSGNYFSAFNPFLLTLFLLLKTLFFELSKLSLSCPSAGTFTFCIEKFVSRNFLPQEKGETLHRIAGLEMAIVKGYFVEQKRASAQEIGF